MQELKIEVFGRVQGIGFRSFIRGSAERLGLRGYVTNREVGSVLVVVQGKRDELTKFLSIIKRGPTLARVEKVSYEWSDSDKRYDRFDIILNDKIRV